MPSVYVDLDMHDINELCDGNCEAGERFKEAVTDALALLTAGRTHEAHRRLFQELTPKEQKEQVERDPMVAAFLEWMKLPADARHAFWDDTHGKRKCP